MKKVVAINASPRKGWNTDRLVSAAAKGAESKGAEIVYFNLFDLEKYTGCVSCFGCMSGATFGKCVCQDGLTDVLDEIREADALVVGTPIYFDDGTASFRALFERLAFQNLTYNTECISSNERPIPVLFVVTCNCPKAAFDDRGITAMLETYRTTFERFVGPTQILVCDDTLQVEDYGKYDWTMFDPAAKKARHDATFGDYLDEAFKIGADLV